VSGTTTGYSVGDIVTLNQSGVFNFWGYPGTGYINVQCGSRIIAISSTTITLQSNFGGVSPVSAGTWGVQPIGIGDNAGGSTQGPDGWGKTSTLKTWADDYAANMCPGAVRVMGTRKGVTGNEIFSWTCPPSQLGKFRGKTVSFGVLVYQKVQGGANTGNAFIIDNGVTTVFSTPATGSSFSDPLYGGYQFLTATLTLSKTCTGFLVGFQSNGNSGDVLYFALPTLIYASSMSVNNCRQNSYDYIPATAHWNPPMLLGHTFNFPGALSLGLYSINGIDIEAISMCQCHGTVSQLVSKVEWVTNTQGAIVFSGNSVNVGGGGLSTQSLKFGPQTYTNVAGVTNAAMGTIPLWYDGTFSLFTANIANLSPTVMTWDFWDVIVTPNSLN
jgi:predicted outer membrane repeat protein